eukprot:g18108.t1
MVEIEFISRDAAVGRALPPLRQMTWFSDPAVHYTAAAAAKSAETRVTTCGFRLNRPSVAQMLLTSGEKLLVHEGLLEGSLRPGQLLLQLSKATPFLLLACSPVRILQLFLILYLTTPSKCDDGVCSECYEENFEETIKAASKVRADSDTFPCEYELQQQLVAEVTWQVNNKPILGTALSAENLHSGTFARGTRDWELQLGEVLLDSKIHDKEVDVFVQRNAIYQEDCRKTISTRDLEMQGRQRELVGRVYFRGQPGPEAVVELPPGECLFTRGVLHEDVRRELETFRTSAQMSFSDGKIFLSSAVEQPVPRERAFDFGALPKVTSLMQNRNSADLQSRLHKGKNDLCFTFSQLLNGRCIKHRLSPKNPGKLPEVHYVVVEATVFHERARGQTPRGRHCFLRWGDQTTPKFVSEEEAQLPVAGTYVARLFFEGVEQALEAVEMYTKGLKSSLLVVKMEDAIKLGFASFCYAACVLEIQAIDRNGVLGRRAKLKDLRGKNIAIRRLPDLADVAEAFLKGKRMVDLYPQKCDQEVYMRVPEDIIELDEKKAVEEKYEKKYFAYKLSQLATIPSTDLRRRIEVLELHSAPYNSVLTPVQNNRGLLNPHSIMLHQQLMPHYQRREAPAGLAGTHVDDSMTSGRLLFYLRLVCLYEFFGLGSFTRLRPGYRDNFVGRELAVVPFGIDQWRVNDYLTKEQDRVELSGIELDEKATEVPPEAELVKIEERTNLSRHTDPVNYPLSSSVVLDRAMFLEDEPEEEVVFYVSQQSYASKLATISHQEVDEFFQARARIASKWARKNLKSPIRGRLGELIWLEKTNSVIAEMLGPLASDAHFAEQAERAADIDKFLDELNLLIGLAQMPEMNILRVYRLAGLHNHFLGGAADASKDKIGGTTFLAARAVMRLAMLSRFGGGKPGRIFHSSTGIEILAQKILASENIFAAQIVYDLHLCLISRSLLQLCDARNALQEPKERNLRPDYHALAMLQRERLVAMGHGAGPKMWADGLTKQPRLANVFMLHMAVNFGLVDKSNMEAIQRHVAKILAVEDEAQLDEALDEEIMTLQKQTEATSSAELLSTVGAAVGTGSDPQGKIIYIRNTDHVDSDALSSSAAPPAGGPFRGWNQ